jgi:hypothetical protein
VHMELPILFKSSNVTLLINATKRCSRIGLKLV